MKSTTPVPLIGCNSQTRHEVDVTAGRSVRSDLTRRAFIRAGLLTGIAGLSWLLLRRSCAGSGACNNCSQFAGCGLPWKVNRP